MSVFRDVATLDLYILGAIWQYLYNLTRIRVVNRELDALTSFPDIHQCGQRTGYDRGILIPQHQVEAVDQLTALNEMPIMIIQLRYAECSSFTDVWIRVLQEALQRFDRRLDELPNMNVG